MSIGEHYAVGAHLVDVAGWDMRVFVVGGDISIAHVVGEDENDVRLLLGLCVGVRG